MFADMYRARVLAIGCAGVLAFACALLAAKARAGAGDAQKPSNELVKLQQEQVATLREASEVAGQLFAHGVGSIADVNRLNRMLVDAELKSATSHNERVSILQDALAAAKKQEEFASQQAQAGVASALAPLEAKAYRLGIEVSLAEEAK